MNQSTIQPEVVESPIMPKWAQSGAEILESKLPTHISSQVDERVWHVLEEKWVTTEYKRKFWVRKMQCKLNGAVFNFNQEAFTCIHCPNAVQTGHYECECCNNFSFVMKTTRCSSCNTRYMRWKRVRKAFKWLSKICEDKKCRPKFLTITKTLRVKSSPFTEEEIEKDRMTMYKEFRMTRKTNAWPNRYAGIWVYEAKVRAPGDEVYTRWPDPKTGKRKLLRIAENFELHGHIHAALATRFIKRDPLLERHEGIHIKASAIDHMKKYLMGYMMVDTVGRYNRIGGEKTWE